VSPVKYELGFYIPEDDILHSHLSPNQTIEADRSVSCDVRASSVYKKVNVFP
jgi:hypothetical protein